MNTQQILIILMIVLFLTGMGCGHAVGYARRRDQIRALRVRNEMLRGMVMEQDARRTAERSTR